MKTLEVDLATVGNVRLYGEQIVDGKLTKESEVLAWKQHDPNECGLYRTSSGAWHPLLWPIGEMRRIRSGYMHYDVYVLHTSARGFVSTTLPTGVIWLLHLEIAEPRVVERYNLNFKLGLKKRGFSLWPFRRVESDEEYRGRVYAALKARLGV